MSLANDTVNDVVNGDWTVDADDCDTLVVKDDHFWEIISQRQIPANVKCKRNRSNYIHSLIRSTILNEEPMLDTNMLEDSHIMFYLRLLQLRCEWTTFEGSDNSVKTYPVVALDLFRTELTGIHEEEALQRLFHTIDFKYDTMALIPLHGSDHWYLGVFDIHNRTFTVYDSLGTDHTSNDTVIKLKDYMERLYNDKMSTNHTWEIVGHVEGLTQPIQNSCGLLVCAYADRLIRTQKLEKTNVTDLRILIRSFYHRLKLKMYSER